MPESTRHRGTVDLFRLTLLAHVARTGRDALVAANLACRWDEARPQVGVDPDIALIEPEPKVEGDLYSLRTWEPGHVPPRFAMEVVSKNHPEKDYVEAPAKYACLGTRELVIFDPDRHGPAGFDHLFQVWRRDESASMVRVHAGDGPAYSEELGAWLFVTERGVLRVADHADGSGLWLTAEESEAAARREEAKARREEAAARAQAEAALLATLRTAVVDLCEAYDVPLDESRRVYLVTLDRDSLESLRAHIKYSRDWPARRC